MEYIIKDTELDGLAFHKDPKTRTKLYNIVKARGDANNIYFKKHWMDLKDWLKHVSRVNKEQHDKLRSSASAARVSLCNFIVSKMEELDKNSIPKSEKNLVTMWFVGADCPKCHEHIYTDG